LFRALPASASRRANAGLTIHYTFKAGQVSIDEAGALLRRLLDAALDLPFDEVGAIA
jgi:hypothetical protein